MAPKSSKSECKQAYADIFSNVSKVENNVMRAQMKEKAMYGRTHSDDEDEDDVDEGSPPPARYHSSLSAPPAPPKSKGLFNFKKKKAMRSRDMSDSFSVELYQNKLSKMRQASKSEEASGSSRDEPPGTTKKDEPHTSRKNDEPNPSNKKDEPGTSS